MAVSLTVSVDGNDFGFDFSDFRIDIDSAIDSLQVGDLWAAIKLAQADQTGIVYEVIAASEGETALSVGVATFLTVKLFDQWEVNTLKSSGKFEVKGGNLVKSNGDDPFVDNPLITYINNLSQAGVIATIETGVSGVVPQDLIDFKNAIFEQIMENSETFAESIRLIRAEAAGKVSVTGQDVSFRDAADSKDRILATTDANGQRKTVITDGT